MKTGDELLVSEGPQNTRLTLGSFFADIIYNSRTPEPLYHWVVQREGDVEILEWGTHPTHEGACAAAQSRLEWRAQQQQSRA